MFRAVTAGQNTALTLFLIVVAWRLVDADRDVAAGLVLALLLYKPQYAIPLIGLLFLSRRWRVVVGAAIGAGGLWALGAIWLGPTWLASWWSQVVPFARLDAQVNAKNSISAPGFAEAIGGGAWSVSGLDASPSSSGLVVSWVWWRRVDQPLAVRMAVAAPAILLMSPHSMFYDASLILISVGVLVAVGPIQRVRAGALVWLLGILAGGRRCVRLEPAVLRGGGSLVVGALDPGAGSTPPHRCAPDGRSPRSTHRVVSVGGRAGAQRGATDRRDPGLDGGVPGRHPIGSPRSSWWTTDRPIARWRSLLPTDPRSRRCASCDCARTRGRGLRFGPACSRRSGDLRLFMDADNATALDQLDRLLRDARLDAAAASVAVGSIAAGETDVRAAATGRASGAGPAGQPGHPGGRRARRARHPAGFQALHGRRGRGRLRAAAIDSLGLRCRGAGPGPPGGASHPRGAHHLAPRRRRRDPGRVLRVESARARAYRRSGSTLERLGVGTPDGGPVDAEAGHGVAPQRRRLARSRSRIRPRWPPSRVDSAPRAVSPAGGSRRRSWWGVSR